MPSYRKLQKIGGSSYFITLPKGWIRKHLLDKDSVISITESATGDIIISPLKNKENYQSIHIKVESEKYEFIMKRIAAAYINGYTDMKITSQDKQILKGIEKFIQSRFPGFILTTEGDDFISLKFVADLGSINFIELFERMDRLTSFMCDEINDKEALKDYDIEVDKLYFLLIRILRTAIMDSSLAKMVGLSAVQILDFRLVLHALERFGDELVILSGTLKPEQLQKIKELKENAIKAFEGYSKITPGKIEELKAQAYNSINTAGIGSKPHLMRLIELASDIADLSETLYK